MLSIGPIISDIHLTHGCMTVFCGFGGILSARSCWRRGRDWRFPAVSMGCRQHPHCHTARAARHILLINLFRVLTLGGQRGIEHGAVADEAGAGMGGGVDLGELGRRYAGVDLRGFQALVTEQGLDEPDVRAACRCRMYSPQMCRMKISQFEVSANSLRG